MILTKRHLILGAIAICLTVVLTVGIAADPITVQTSTSTRDLPIYCVETSEKKVAISFDAAWGAEDTPKLIEILAKYHVPATFFVVGQWVDKYPEAVKALYEAGHDVMNHSDTHPHMTELTAEKIIREADVCSDKIQNVTGQRPDLLRPPYGDYNDNVIRTLKDNGYYPIQWDVDSLDWKGLSASAIRKRVLDKVRPGSIVLFHNAAEHTPEALPGIIEELQGRGYTFVKISDLILRESYQIDHTGKQSQIDKKQDGFVQNDKS